MTHPEFKDESCLSSHNHECLQGFGKGVCDSLSAGKLFSFSLQFPPRCALPAPPAAASGMRLGPRETILSLIESNSSIVIEADEALLQKHQIV